MNTNFTNSVAIKTLKEETVKMSDFFAEMDAKIAAAQKVVTDAEAIEYTSINERLEDNNWKLVYNGPSSEWYKKGDFVITVKGNETSIFKTNEHVKDEDFSVYTSVKLLSNCMVIKK